MIEVSNINPVHKNSLLATCTVHIKPWKLFLHEVAIFEKGAQRWIGMPSRQYDKDGEKKYVELITFDNDAAKKRFRDQIMTAVDKFLASNPDCTPEDVIKDDAELPFLGDNMQREHAVSYEEGLTFAQIEYVCLKANKLGGKGKRLVRAYQEEDSEGKHLYFEIVNELQYGQESA